MVGLTALALVATLVVVLVSRALPAQLASYAPAAIAVIFLAVPALAAHRRGQALADWGFTLSGPQVARRSLICLGVVLLVVFPLFAIGFVGFFSWACEQAPAIGQAVTPGACRWFGGWEALGSPRLPPDFAELALAQVVIAAIPEEVFFRGYVLGRLEEVLPPRRRLWGGGLGWALVISSALFAVSHLAADPDPRRLATFFPGLLFGWMRSATGSIAAGAAVHAAANLYVVILQRTVFAR
jgi:membrane protease YdiL (CAAX protease family)